MLKKWPGSVLVIVAFFICTATAHAGIYNTAETYKLARSFADFRETLIEVTRINLKEIDLGGKKMPIETPLRKRALLATSLLDPLALRRGTVELTPDQSLNLSAYLIRLNKNDEATDLLESALAGRGSKKPLNDFLLYSNMGTAWQQKGLQSRAASYLKMALAKWPEKFDKLSPEQREYFLKFGWNEGPHEWYRKVEQYHLKLVEDGFNKDIPEIAGVLFSKNGKPIQFVGEGGKYEAGKLARAERKKLPLDNIEIIEQLLVWFPGDNRLYWLLGELLNARGNEKLKDVESAYRIFDDLVYNRQNRSPIVREHRQALKTYLEKQQSKKVENAGAGVKKKDDNAWNPNPWQMFGVGFLAGAIVLLFASWQVRMLRRR